MWLFFFFKHPNSAVRGSIGFSRQGVGGFADTDSKKNGQVAQTDNSSSKADGSKASFRGMRIAPFADGAPCWAFFWAPKIATLVCATACSAAFTDRRNGAFQGPQSGEGEPKTPSECSTFRTKHISPMLRSMRPCAKRPKASMGALSQEQ